MHFSIPKTIELVSQCWGRAEDAIRQRWKKRNVIADEPYITGCFWDNLNDELEAATSDGALKRAFQEDLCHAFPRLQSHYGTLDQITHGLFMDCRLHDKGEEEVTGGDYGLSIIQPEFHARAYESSIRLKEHGLLCQAKIRRKTGKWGSLTTNQGQVLPPYLGFASLVLYDYSQIKGSPLDPFKWQLCGGFAIEEVKRWLLRDSFPSILSSKEVLLKLSKGEIGTCDEKFLRDVIRSTARPELRIRITWRDGVPPDGIKIPELSHVRQPVLQHA
jgi:hypothetical protein